MISSTARDLPEHHKEILNACLRQSMFPMMMQYLRRQQGDLKAAREFLAYQFAWCDGPPFAYHWGLEKARKLLQEMGAGEPLMPPFDAAKFEPMAEVEIDPLDEFHAGTDDDAS